MLNLFAGCLISAQGRISARPGGSQVFCSHAQLTSQRLNTLSQRSQLQLHHLYSLSPHLLRRSMLLILFRAPAKKNTRLHTALEVNVGDSDSSSCMITSL